jgi:hypothetical protein
MPIRLIKKVYFIISVIWFSVVLSTPVQARDDTNNNSVSSVIETFKLSIQDKNEALFMSLFHDQNVSWVGVISDETLGALIAIDPKFKQQPKIMNSTPSEFIKGIASSEHQSKEVFKNINIRQDDEVASVSFEYDFYKDDKLSNFGQEHWQLIKTKHGWKINAVNFSFTRAL